MARVEEVKALLEHTDQFHEEMVQQARAVSRFRDILAFLLRCLEFMERHLPQDLWQPWLDDHAIIPALVQRGLGLQPSLDPDNPLGILAVTTSGSSASSDAFSVITDNINFLEDRESRADYSALALSYRDLLAGPVQRSEVVSYFAPVNVVVTSKFEHSIDAFHSLPRGEDPQGPLLEMRSAIDIALDSLLKLTPLSRKERGDLREAAIVPTIAHHLAKNDVSKMDLIIANERFQKLKARLSASKETVIEREQAENLISEAIALLHLLSATLRGNPQHREGNESTLNQPRT